MSAALFRRRPDVVVAPGGAGRYATDLSTGEVHELNETAALVLDAALQGQGPEGIVDRLHAAYPDVPHDELARDVGEVLDEMVRLGILERG